MGRLRAGRQQYEQFGSTSTRNEALLAAFSPVRQAKCMDGRAGGTAAGTGVGDSLTTACAAAAIAACGAACGAPKSVASLQAGLATVGDTAVNVPGGMETPGGSGGGGGGGGGAALGSGKQTEFIGDQHRLNSSRQQQQQLPWPQQVRPLQRCFEAESSPPKGNILESLHAACVSWS